VRSEEGAKCGAISGRGGVIWAVTACTGGGGSGTWSGFRRNKKVRPTDRVGPPVSEGRCAGQAGQAGPEGGGRDMGRGWAGKERRRLGQNHHGLQKIPFQILNQGFEFK
jgi:hypothetical protein